MVCCIFLFNPNGESVCNNLTHFSLVSNLLMYLNLQDGSTVVFAVACFWCQSFDDFSLMCVHIILIPFGLLSGHLLKKSCSFC